MPFEADLIIAQSVQSTDDAGVSALGMGWQVRDPEPIPWARVLMLRASRDLVGTEHVAKIRLEGDGDFEIDENLADLMQIELQFTPQGLTDQGFDSPVLHGFGFNLLPVPLEPGAEYRFRLWVDEETRDHWVAHFRTTPP
jgi:hypothetical protein